MRKYQRKKLNKILLILAIVLVIVAITIAFILHLNSKNKMRGALYEDKVKCNNYFTQIKVDFNKKEVRRDEIKTSFQKEFNVTEEQENVILSSIQELQNFFSDTVFEIDVKDNIAYITNKYQTKKLLLEVESLKGEFKEAIVTNLQDNLYLLEYNTQKQTKEAFENLSSINWIKKIELDEVLYIEPINDESQTVYGEKEEQNKSKYHTYGVEAMGLANYKNIISENGNPYDVVVATVGYGVCIENKYFNGRIDEKYYNFIENSKNISETIPQGSRVAEVIKDATERNVKIMPLVVVNNEGYTTISAIVSALEYAIQNSDIICYELINKESYMIDLVLKKAFKENKPISCVTVATQKEKNHLYPANSATTIAVSSIDKNNELTIYSGTGNYIDFSAYSTDVEEVFNKNSTVSRWSGSQYSNAHIVSAIALIKSYNKDYTILEIYNILRNYCIDLGEKGKDEKFGYGCPDFSKITIKDIDKEAPVIKEVLYDTENWEQSKKIQIIASDNIRILAWAVTTSDEVPKEWNKLAGIDSSLDIIYEVTENNKYYIWVMDSAQRTTNLPIEVNKVDTAGPEISYQIDKETLEAYKYITLKITAEDKDSGLNDMPYSWDGENWGTENNILKVMENGRYKIYVKDLLENISEKEILVDVFPRAGIANISEGTIIKSVVVSSSWNGDTNNGVRITFNEGLNLIGYTITTSSDVPEYFEGVDLEYEDEDAEEDEEIEEENTVEENIVTDEENDINIIIDEETTEENDINILTEDTETENNELDENSITDEENLVENEVYEDLEEPELQGYNSSYTITKSLKTGVTYYAWIKDINNNVLYQSFNISKVEI